MQDTIIRWLENFVDASNRNIAKVLLSAIGDRLATRPLITSGLALKAGGSAVVKTGAADFYAIVSGRLVKIAASTDMPALVGTITAAYFNVFSFFVDNAGTTTVLMGKEGASLAEVIFPPWPEGKACIGSILVTYASTFTGGTTPLDTATTVYLPAVGGVDPTVLLR